MGEIVPHLVPDPDIIGMEGQGGSIALPERPQRYARFLQVDYHKKVCRPSYTGLLPLQNNQRLTE
jgi:hypothetical protein